MGIELEGFVGRSAMANDQREAILACIPQKGTFMEVGTLDGVSVAYWAKNRPEVFFVSVDPFKHATGTGPGNFANWEQNHGPNQILICGTTRDLWRWKGMLKSFDVVFVDGDHSEEATMYDMDVAVELLKEGGQLLVHDFKTGNPRLEGVDRAVEVFCIKRRWEIYQKVGTVIWLRKIR